MEQAYIPLKEKYQKDVVPAMIKEFGYKNRLEVPRVEKVVLNMGIGEATRTADLIDTHGKELAEIAGQRPVVTRARKSISNFKIRQGMPVGLKVTLRGQKMYNFLYKLISIALPKLRDFGGVDQDSFDGRGNYALGLPEQLVFPEMTPDKVKRLQGLDVIIVTNAKTDEESRALLKHLGMPFKR